MSTAITRDYTLVLPDRGSLTSTKLDLRQSGMGERTNREHKLAVRIKGVQHWLQRRFEWDHRGSGLKPKRT